MITKRTDEEATAGHSILPWYFETSIPGAPGAAIAGTAAGTVSTAVIEVVRTKTTCLQRRATHPTGTHPLDHQYRPVVARTITPAPDPVGMLSAELRAHLMGRRPRSL